MPDKEDAPPSSPLPFLEAIRNRGNAPPSASKTPSKNPPNGGNTTPTPKVSSTPAIKTPTATPKQQADRSPAAKTPPLKKAPVALPQPPPAAPIPPPRQDPSPPARAAVTPKNESPVNDSTASAGSEKGLKMHKSGKFKVIVDLPQIEQAFQKITCKYN